jgi:hypothetical protein
MGEKVIVNIRTFFDGHRPPDRVIAELQDTGAAAEAN